MRAARVGLTAVFAVDGAVFASWAARVPQVQEAVGAGAGALGAALVGTAVGALPAMVATGWLCRRLRAMRVACVMVLLLCAAVLLPGRVHTPLHLGAVLVVFGACYGATDVAMNTAAVDLAARAGRPIVPAFHGAFSVGSLLGAGLGALAAGAGVTVPNHLTAVAIAAAVIIVATTARPFWAASAARDGTGSESPDAVLPVGERRLGHAPARRRGDLAVLRAAGLAAVITGAAAFAEGVVANWSGVHLLTAAHTPVWAAPLGFAFFASAEALMRLCGPRLLERLGARGVGTAGAALAAVALGLTLIPSGIVAVAAYAAAGVGLANLFPLGIARAGRIGGSLGVSAASTIGYGGFLLGPPLVGLIAGATSLTPALILPVVVVAAAGIAARRLTDDRRPPAPARPGV